MVPSVQVLPASFRPGAAFTNGSRDRWVLAGYRGMCQKAAPGGPASWKWKGAWDDEPARRQGPAIRRRRGGSDPSCRDGLAVHRGAKRGGPGVRFLEQQVRGTAAVLRAAWDLLPGPCR